MSKNIKGSFKNSQLMKAHIQSFCKLAKYSKLAEINSFKICHILKYALTIYDVNSIYPCKNIQLLDLFDRVHKFIN